MENAYSPGIMPARKIQTLNERWRSRIKASMIINRLQNNALGKLKKPMTPDQIRCAHILLAKALPDLKAIENTGVIDHHLEISWKS